VAHPQPRTAAPVTPAGTAFPNVSKRRVSDSGNGRVSDSDKSRVSER